MAKLKDKLIMACPDTLFPPLTKLLSHGNTRITKANQHWIIHKDQLTLASPTPKFVGFGIKQFTGKFERYFKIERGETALDVGACIGDTTLPMAWKVGAKGKVIAIEPHPTNFEYLTRNLSGFSNVTLIEKAVASARGKMPLHISKATTGHSLIVNSDDSIMVEVDTLDHLLGNTRIDYVKIDVQGSEVDVLNGSSHLLRTVKKLVVETHDRTKLNATYPQVLEILRQFKFTFLQYDSDNGVVYASR